MSFHQALEHCARVISAAVICSLLLVSHAGAARAGLSATELMADAEKAVAADDYDKALELLGRASAVARHQGQGGLSREIQEIQKRATMLRRKFRQVELARAKLKTSPLDPVVNLKLGMFYCFAKEDWDSGLPALSLSDDATLKEVAEMDIAQPKQPAMQFRVGQQWLDAASKVRDAAIRRVMHLRARKWFLEAAAATQDEDQRRAIRARLEQIELYPTKIVIWNTHNGSAGDRGTLLCNLILLREGMPVSAGRVPLRWSNDEPARNVVLLPGKRADEVRIEIVKWYRNGGGLAEVAVFQDETNLARGVAVKASAVFGSRFRADNLTDGIIGDGKTQRGYWLLPDKQLGWVLIQLNRPR